MILKYPIKSLTLVSSAGCNLKCEYCLLNASKNKNSSTIQNKIIQSFQNGDYLKNVISVLNRLSSSPNSIEFLEFWGQEPTLTLNYFTEHLQDWLINFPNIRRIMFSTNGIEYGNKIVSFLKQIDLLTKNKIQINIQFSYDENYSNINCRHADSDIITNNIKYIISEINKLNFTNITVKFCFHAVISNQLVNTLQTLNEVNNYCKNLFEWPKEFIILNKNPKLEIEKLISFGIESPVDASQEDGIKFSNFCKLINKCDYNLNNNKIVSKGLTKFVINDTYRCFNSFCSSKNDIIELLKESMNNNLLNKLLSSERGFCRTNYQDLKIMYDGSLVGCQNQVFDTEIEFINSDDKFLYSIKKDQVTHKRIINPLIENDEELKKFFYTHYTVVEDNFKIIYNNTLNLMYILAKCNQIDKEYLYDKNKMLTSAFYLAKFNNCYYNAIIKTGNSFFKHCGFIRFFCNGALQEIMIGDKINE